MRGPGPGDRLLEMHHHIRGDERTLRQVLEGGHGVGKYSVTRLKHPVYDGWQSSKVLGSTDGSCCQEPHTSGSVPPHCQWSISTTRSLLCRPGISGGPPKHESFDQLHKLGRRPPFIRVIEDTEMKIASTLRCKRRWRRPITTQSPATSPDFTHSSTFCDSISHSINCCHPSFLEMGPAVGTRHESGYRCTKHQANIFRNEATDKYVTVEQSAIAHTDQLIRPL